MAAFVRMYAVPQRVWRTGVTARRSFHCSWLRAGLRGRGREEIFQGKIGLTGGVAAESRGIERPNFLRRRLYEENPLNPDLSYRDTPLLEEDGTPLSRRRFVREDPRASIPKRGPVVLEWTKRAAESVFRTVAKRLDGGITWEQEQAFSELCNEVLNYNQKVNITAHKTRDAVYVRHFVNSLILIEVVDKLRQGRSPYKVIDIGTGPGFPGFPLAILRPDVQVTLNDATRKKCAFHCLTAEALNLKNVESVWARAEELGRAQEFRGAYDLSMSRALARLNVVVELAMPLTKVGGYHLAMKAISPDQGEIKEAKTALKLLGAELVDLVFDPNTAPDDNGNSYALLVIEKKKETDPRYPRGPGTPEKSPIGNGRARRH